MNSREQGFLLLTSQLGNPDRRPLSMAQLRTLTARMQGREQPREDRDLNAGDLRALGYGPDQARWILGLLEEQDLLEHYLRRGDRALCVPLTRVSPGYPAILRQRLGGEAPGCLWARGDLGLLEKPAVSLVGSRDLKEENRAFAREAGRQAAKQGFVLVSGNARGADREAQEACLASGGSVISVVADVLTDHPRRDRVLYLSEDGFDSVFSTPRALSRNRVIHGLGRCVLVAQATLQKGGTWDGTSRNLRFGWSPVGCFQDGSDAFLVLTQMGAQPVTLADLEDLSRLCQKQNNFFDK